MRVENLAQPAMKGFIAPLLFLCIGIPSARALAGAQEGQSALPSATAGQSHESPAKSRPLNFEERADILWLASITRMLWITITGL